MARRKEEEERRLFCRACHDCILLKILPGKSATYFTIEKSRHKLTMVRVYTITFNLNIFLFSKAIYLCFHTTEVFRSYIQLTFLSHLPVRCYLFLECNGIRHILYSVVSHFCGIGLIYITIFN